MPYIVHGELHKNTHTSEDYHYKYPDGLNLKPGSELHNELVSKILQRATESRNEVSKRFSSWRDVDKKMTVYTTPESGIRDSDPDKPVKIVFPYSYSMIEALLTYIGMSFFQDPIFQYEGVEDDDTIGAALMELLIRSQCIKTKVPLYLHTIFRDALTYGIGIGIPIWTTQYGRVPVRNNLVLETIIGDIEKESISFEEKLIFEGNGLQNIDPYMWLPDPSVSSIDVQKGEFVGWLEQDNLMNMLSKENSPGTNLINVKYLKNTFTRKSSLSLDQSDRQTKFGSTSELTMSTNPVDNIKMYVNLIPKEWQLGSSEYPEKWFFQLSGDSIITACEKANHNHGMYPVAVTSPEYDGYSITPISRMEVLYGLQHTLDFLFNSRIAEIKRGVNGMMVVDPSLVNIEDLRDPRPGKLIRLHKPAWGRGIDKVIQQLQYSDVTVRNIADSQYITQWMDRISGADQSMQGAVRQSGPERLTRTEFQGTRGSAVSRLQHLSLLISYQLMQDIGTMFAVHNQQYLTKDTFVKATGRYGEQLQALFREQNIKVSPKDISVNYDLIIRDGTIPGNNIPDTLTQMFGIIGRSPELSQQFDMVRLFSYIAKESGVKNLEDFKKKTNQIQPQVMPDEQLNQQVQAGNLVPMGAMQ